MFDLDARPSRHQILDQADNHRDFLEIIVTGSFVLRLVDSIDTEEEDGKFGRRQPRPLT